jgi:hypothetical protein
MFDTIAANVILHSKTEQLCSAESMELRSQRFIRLKLPKQNRAPAPSVQFHALETLSLSGCSVDLAVLLPRYPRLGPVRFDVTPFLDKVPAASGIGQHNIVLCSDIISDELPLEVQDRSMTQHVVWLIF